MPTPDLAPYPERVIAAEERSHNGIVTADTWTRLVAFDLGAQPGENLNEVQLLQEPDGDYLVAHVIEDVGGPKWIEDSIGYVRELYREAVQEFVAWCAPNVDA